MLPILITISPPISSPAFIGVILSAPPSPNEYSCPVWIPIPTIGSSIIPPYCDPFLPLPALPFLPDGEPPPPVVPPPVPPPGPPPPPFLPDPADPLFPDCEPPPDVEPPVPPPGPEPPGPLFPPPTFVLPKPLPVFCPPAALVVGDPNAPCAYPNDGSNHPTLISPGCCPDVSLIIGPGVWNPKIFPGP